MSGLKSIPHGPSSSWPAAKTGLLPPLDPAGMRIDQSGPIPKREILLCPQAFLP